MENEIINLHIIFIDLFNQFNNNLLDYKNNNESRISEIGFLNNPIIFNYNFNKEFDYGFIEYKRTLIFHDTKKNKLLRQIYWRISEFSNYILDIYDTNQYLCYYIIGLENSGIYSNINTNELLVSLDIIKKTIYNTYIKCEHVFLYNKEYCSYVLLVKLYIDNINYINSLF